MKQNFQNEWCHSPRRLDVEPRRFDPRPVLTEGDVREEDVHARGGEEVFLQNLDELRLVLRLHREVLEELEVDPQPRHGRDVTEVHMLALELLDDAFSACLDLQGAKNKKHIFTVWSKVWREPRCL